MNLKDCKRLKSLPKRICEFNFLKLLFSGCSRLEKLLGDWEERQSSVNLKASRTYRSEYKIVLFCLVFAHYIRIHFTSEAKNSSLGALQEFSRNSKASFKYPRSGCIQLHFYGNFLVEHQTRSIHFTEDQGSSVTMELQNSDWYNDDFLGFSVCLVFAPQAERPQLNPEILCDLNYFTFSTISYRPQARARAWHTELDSVDQECGNTSTDHVWLAYRPQARADRCHPKERNRLKASFEVFNCVVKECAIRLIYKKQVVFGQEAQ
ncbi:hypothetical protein AAG906_026784 [Vitis piasezkii]